MNRRAVRAAGKDMTTLLHRLDRFDAAVHRWLVSHSISLLRLSLGLIFVFFGLLKFFPGVSPAEGLVKDTTDVLTLGLVPGSVSLVAIATLECTIGACLISGRYLRLAVYLLGLQMIGVLSPLVFFPGRLFDGRYHAPTLEGQYVLKDIILATSTAVIATTLRGGRIERGDRSAVPVHDDATGRAFTAEEKLSLVLDGLRAGGREQEVRALCADHRIAEGDYRRWQDEFMAGAAAGLATAGKPVDSVPPPA